MIEATEYAEVGMALVSIPTGRKGPSSKGWNKLDNVITDPQKASALEGNIGLAHAYSSPPTMALDIDDLPQAKEWLAARGIDLDALLTDDDGVQISSGREGRAKLLYRLPAGVDPIRMTQIKDPKTKDVWLEFRCASSNGLTVQDVLPPSIHPDTSKPYQWAGNGDWRKMPEIPEQLLEVWRNLMSSASPPKGEANATPLQAVTTAVDPVTIQHLRSALLSMRADDFELWIKAGLALKTLGDVGRGLWMEWSLTSEKSQDKGPLVLARTWEGFAPTQIGYQFIFAEAQRGGWVNPARAYAVVGTADANEDGSWAMPQSLPNKLRKVKPLDLGCLPSTIRDAVADIAERLSCPVDYVATSLLVGAGAIVGNRVGILPKQHDDTWEVYPALWGGIVGPPGSMKTPVQQETMKPLRHIEEQDSNAYAASFATFQLEGARQLPAALASNVRSWLWDPAVPAPRTAGTRR